MGKLRDNKSFQTIVGAGVIYVLFRLWRDGWISWLLGNDPASEGFSSPAVWLAVGQAILSFVQMVGILAIGVVSGVLPHLEDAIEMAGKGVKSLAVKGRDLAKNWKNAEKKEGQFNWKPAASILLAWVLWSGGHLSTIIDAAWDLIPNVIVNDGDAVSGKVKAVLFSMDPESVTAKQNEVTISGKVDQMLMERGIERRRLLATQGPASGEPWLAQAIAAAPDQGSTLVVVLADGATKVIDLPADVDSMVGLIVSWD